NPYFYVFWYDSLYHDRSAPIGWRRTARAERAIGGTTCNRAEMPGRVRWLTIQREPLARRWSPVPAAELVRRSRLPWRVRVMRWCCMPTIRAMTRRGLHPRSWERAAKPTLFLPTLPITTP